ncbi:hypothetical protein FIBSPDRAFT_833637 [Athelia psychrophila]|uniref:Microtubule associated protein n=2 Tax=Athelia psychrophila TaxID=1759441 RepID=A0A166DLW5_9AGAM|nr:hypothetical protein FIBSPDRAFT_833637 [Fibularhizoctonia sp. CBS 109695]
MSLTLTSLLDSLHTHLQTQTELLPTLHAQLGLPSNALEDELKILQQHLMQSVESQIDVRRKEVDEWMGKCSGVEDVCVRYGKALGANVKVAGASIGELRKEQVLPKRYQLVTAQQEKLRQVYHTKLEQLTTLTTKLNVLARTLGKEFFQPDIIHAALAPGENASDTNAHRDVTPERFSTLEKELVRAKGETAKRLTQLSEMMIQIEFLHTELGITTPSISDLPSSAFASPSFRTSTSSSSSDPFAFDPPSTPTPSSSCLKASTPFLFGAASSAADTEASYQRIFARFVAQIEEAESEDLGIAEAALSNIEPTPGLLAWAQSTHDALAELKLQRESHIQAMYDQLEGLWRRLGVAESDMDGFVEAHRGSTEDVVNEYEDELERMMELKRERMGVFVANARTEISKLWDDMMVGQEERGDFAPFVDGQHTEELLTIHEEEIKRLKEERRMKAPLLAAIKKYFEISEEEKELAAAASDQSRLLGRGPRDPGRLLREEKMRKRVQKEKPRLEQDLLLSIPTWEEEAGRPFLVHGESIMRILSETSTATEQENKRKQGSRAGSAPPRATTPVNSSNHYVPGSSTGGGKGVVTPAVRAGSAMREGSIKRQKLGDSTTSGGPARTVLGTHRGNTNAGRNVSPSKVPGSRSVSAKSLQRPVAVSMHMPVPRPGTQHHALGHGRVPSGLPMSRSVSAGARAFSGSVRAFSGSAAVVSKKLVRTKRESFKPRPSVDDWDQVHGARRGGLAGRSVKEEEEVF